MSSERNYYLVPEGSETAKAIQEWQEHNREVVAQWSEFAESYGSGHYFHNRRRLTGLSFDEPPEGWVRGKNGFRPHARRKAAADDYLRFSRLPSAWDGWKLADMLDTGVPVVGGMALSGMALSVPTFERIGDNLILSLHAEHAVPPDVTPLKHSEYWALKEQAA